jgi:hypothetical protein
VGPISFEPGVNHDSALFGGATYIIYTDDVWAAATGSVSLWVKKISADAAGGIWQIGNLGQPNSKGVFYSNQTDVVFEARNAQGDLTAVPAPGVLSEGEWTHITAVWTDGGNGCDLLLFVNGAYTGHSYGSGAFNHTTDQLRVGVTGYHGCAQAQMDEVRFSDWRMHDAEVYAEYVYSSERFLNQPTIKPVSTGPVQVVGKSLYVDGRPFRVKGVGYAPTPIGFWPGGYPIYSDPDIIARDLPLLEAMNVNTIRTWAPPPDQILLDALYYDASEPIYAIIGFWIPLDGMDDYGDPATIAFYENEFQELVNRFKDHPAVLAWGIGNEVNLGLPEDELADWYTLANRLAEVAYAEEGATYHPTVVVNGDIRGACNMDHCSDDAAMDHVDFWGHNVYFGWDAHCYFDYYDRLSSKPLIVTEYGIDAWDDQSGTEYQAVQAAWAVQQWRQIKAGSAGATIMAYSDEWWKAGDPSSHDFGGYATAMHPDGYSNEEWWGMVAVQDNGSAPDLAYPREVYYALAAEYADVCGDYDGDGDTDLADFAALQQCHGMAAVGPCGAAFEFLVDGMIDLGDFAMFATCLNGPDRPPACPE